MNVNFNEFKNICNLMLERDRMLNEIPSAFREGFWNNPYDNNATMIIETMANKLFGSDLADWLFWYLYDKPEGILDINVNKYNDSNNPHVTVNKNSYRIETDEDFYSMIQKEYFSD
jgi:hypothetical protein